MSKGQIRLAIASLLFLCLFELDHKLRAAGAPGLEVLPRHFLLRPGEQIHYQVLERSANGRLRSVDYEFAIKDPKGLSVNN